MPTIRQKAERIANVGTLSRHYYGTDKRVIADRAYISKRYEHHMYGGKKLNIDAPQLAFADFVEKVFKNQRLR